MATTDRLEHESPDLAAVIAGLPDAERVSLVQQAVESVAAAAGIADECRSAVDLDGLVVRLDEEAWNLQAAAPTSADYERAFRRARAANAWLFAATDHSLAGSCEAIYEAIHAVGGEPDQVAALLAR